METKEIYIKNNDIYVLDTQNKCYLIAVFEKLSLKKIREVVNDLIVPEEFYDGFSGTLADAIDWLEQHRVTMIETFEQWLREYTDFDIDIYDGKTKIVGRYIGDGAPAEWTGRRQWDKIQDVKWAIINGGFKFNNIRTVLDYYYKGE